MDIINADVIEQYNDIFGFETKNPLVAVVEFPSPKRVEHYRMNFGFYSLFLKNTKGCVINYGKTIYDFDDDTVVCFAPGQNVEISLVDGTEPKSIGLLFHPDLLHRMPLAQKIKQYSYFSYESNEALHLSAEERMIIVDCINKIRREIDRPIDKFSKSLINTNIELLLDYCMRFYDRQFITRDVINYDILSKFENLIDDYLNSGLTETVGIPTVKYFADKVCLSPNYFGDLLKKETGRSAQEYIQQKMVSFAKERVLDPSKSISQISDLLGFKYPQHFVRFFKRNVGQTPSEYRNLK